MTYYTGLGYDTDVVQPYKNSERVSRCIPDYAEALENSRKSNYLGKYLILRVV